MTIDSVHHVPTCTEAENESDKEHGSDHDAADQNGAVEVLIVLVLIRKRLRESSVELCLLLCTLLF